MTKVTSPGKGAARNDSIGLCREQHAELYAREGELRLVVDHPSNAPLIGAHARAILVRATELTVGVGDGTAAVYVCRGGGTLRIATATVVRHRNGTMGLMDWQIQPGFDHTATTENGSTVHRINRSAGSRQELEQAPSR